MQDSEFEGPARGEEPPRHQWNQAMDHESGLTKVSATLACVSPANFKPIDPEQVQKVWDVHSCSHAHCDAVALSMTGIPESTRAAQPSYKIYKEKFGHLFLAKQTRR